MEAEEMSSGFNNMRLTDQTNYGVKGPIAVISEDIGSEEREQ